jgi:hypothetical protein
MDENALGFNGHAVLVGEAAHGERLDPLRALDASLRA